MQTNYSGTVVKVISSNYPKTIFQGGNYACKSLIQSFLLNLLHPHLCITQLFCEWRNRSYTNAVAPA